MGDIPIEKGDLVVETGGTTRALKDLFAGAAGGIAQVLIGNQSSAMSSAINRLRIITLKFRF